MPSRAVLDASSRAHLSKPAGELRGREIIARGHRGLKLGAAPRRDDLLERLLGYFLQPGQWDRLLRLTAAS